MLPQRLELADGFFSVTEFSVATCSIPRVFRKKRNIGNAKVWLLAIPVARLGFSESGPFSMRETSKGVSLLGWPQVRPGSNLRAPGDDGLQALHRESG